MARAAGVRAPGPGFHGKVAGKSWRSLEGHFLDGAGFGARKATEIESLNGYIVRRGAELGVATPSNFALYAMVRLLEEKAVREQPGARPAGAAQ